MRSPRSTVARPTYAKTIFGLTNIKLGTNTTPCGLYPKICTIKTLLKMKQTTCLVRKRKYAVLYAVILQITKTWWLPHLRFLTRQVVCFILSSVLIVQILGYMPQGVVFVPSFMLVRPKIVLAYVGLATVLLEDLIWVVNKDIFWRRRGCERPYGH